MDARDDRRVNTIDAVADLVRSKGLEVNVPVSLRSTNNVVAWLAPSPVVVKISRDHERAVRELEIVRALVEVDAPVIPPIDVGIGQPLIFDEKTVTFWRYEAQDDAIELSSEQVAESLFVLHSKLAVISDRVSLPSYEERLRVALRILEDAERTPELPAEDRALLRQALVGGLSWPRTAARGRNVLHGSPHRLNLLAVGGDPRFIDFETVERGPLEWDLAHLESKVADLYPGELDSELTTSCRIIISAATATWCWAALDRGPDMRNHAEHHLDVVRSSVG